MRNCKGMVNNLYDCGDGFVYGSKKRKRKIRRRTKGSTLMKID